MDRAGSGEQSFTTCRRTLTDVFGKTLSGGILPAWAEGKRGRLTGEESIEAPTFHWQGRPWQTQSSKWKQDAWLQEYNRKPLGTKYLEVELQAWGPNWVCRLGFQSCFDFLIPHLYWHFRIQISECLLPVCWMLTVLRNDHFPFGFESPKERERKLQELHRRTVSKDSQGASPTETELRWLLNFKPSSSGSSFSSTLREFLKID